MSKFKKIIFIFITIMILTIIAGGIYTLHENQKNDYINTQKKRIDLFLNKNIKGYENLTLTTNKISPMGAIEIKGYVNHDKNLYFKATIWGDENNQFENSMRFSPDLNKILKQSNSSRKKASEIIKEKHLNKEDYEADPPFIF
ncbi:DUF1433 domain-containing protein [Staphylococcus hsinchuensis]|uniref:DUF1433 domain-containing protein n=1 Tax=Staphylococcus hsinchuensis TaxID=3051183 RepID=A0ABZ3EG13_9STAP